MEDKEINKSSPKSLPDQEVLITSISVKELIGDIFHASNDGNYKIFVKNSNLIPNLLEFLALNTKEKSSEHMLEKIELINFLTKNFLLVAHNQEIFSKFKINSKTSFSYFPRWSIFHILIDLYLRELNQLFLDFEEDKIPTNDLNSSDDMTQKLQKSILDCLEVLINNIVLNKDVMEFVYQKFAVYYRILNKYPNEKSLHSRNLIDKFIQLLKVLYGERLNISKPYNYFYFSGNGSLKVSEKSLQEEKIKLNNGFVFSFWFRPTFYNSTNSSCDLLTVKCNTKDNQKLQLSLVNNKLYFKNLSDKEHIHEFPNDQLSHISFIIKPKSFLKNTELILITEKNISNYSIPYFNSECEVTEITFFQNFIGQVTSILFLSKAVSEEYVKLLRNMPYGIHKEKILQKFMKSAYNKYLTNSNKKFSNLPFTQKDSEGIASIIDNIKFCYTPFRYSTSQSTNTNSSLSEKTIYDLCGKYNAVFLNYDWISGVHSYHSYQKNIFFLGGINNIIPLVEMIMCHGNLLDNSTFLNLMELINVILNYRKKNMNDAVNKNFFPMLSLFLEKFPNELFQENILSILLTLGRSLFAFVDECQLSIIYFEYILLNEKIFTKFSIHLQSDLWRSLYQFYVSDVSQIKSFMKMSKVCLILRYYDINRFHEYCCQEHADMFNQEKEYKQLMSVMKPDMKDKIENLINIVNLIVEENILEEVHSLMKLLALDLSPCLQKYIIRVFIDYFNITNFTRMNEIIEKKQKTLNYLITNNFIDILLYVISVSLVDVRCECLKLFTNLSNQYFKEIMKKPLEKICTFLKEFILPFNYNSIKLNNPLDTDSALLQNKKERSLGLYPNSDKDLKKYNTTLNKNKLIKINPSLAEKQSDNVIREKTKEISTDTSNGKVLLTAKNSTKSSFSFDTNKIEEFIQSSNVTTKSISILNKTKDDDKENKENTMEVKETSTLPIKIESKILKKPNLSIQVNEDGNQKQTEKKTALKLKLPERKLPLKDLDTNSLNEKTLHSSRSENIDLKSVNLTETSDSNTNVETSQTTKLETEENTENKPKRTIKHHLKSISVDMNAEKSNSLPTRKNIAPANTLKERKINIGKIKLDVDNINKIYKFGGDKNEINMSEEEKNSEQDTQIRMLAKHCVDFMNGEAVKSDCLRFNYATNNNAFQMKAMNDKYHTLQNEPRSVKGEKKINLMKFGTYNEKVIEEDPGEIIPSSPFKPDDQSESSGKKLSDKKTSPKPVEAIEKAKENIQHPIEKKVLKLSIDDNNVSPTKKHSIDKIIEKVEIAEKVEKINIEEKSETQETEVTRQDKFRNTVIAQTPKAQSSKGIQIVDDYLCSNTKPLNEISFQHDKELENLTNYFNKEIYNHNLEMLFESCFDWLVGKKSFKKRSFSDESQTSRNEKKLSITTKNITYLDEDVIVNPQVIDVIIRMAVNTEVTYLQKLMQDFYLIMLHNKENCCILYKNSNFYTWLIETTFKHYQQKTVIEKSTQEDNSALSLSIYEQGKRIHSELIMNAIIREEKLKSEPMNKINFLLSWGLYYKNLYDYNRKISLEVNDFIKNLLSDILNVFKEKLSVCSPNINLSIWENFASFSILSYEFITFYNLEKTLKSNSISFVDLLYEKLIVPRCILSGLHLDSSEIQEDQSSHNPSLSITGNESLNKTSVKDLWSDYVMFESIYSCYSQLFTLNKTIFNNLSLTNEENLSDNQYLKSLEDFLGNKKKKDTFMEDFRVLTYYFKSDFSNKFNNYDIPVIKIISNLLTITLSVIEDENEIKFWLSQYENFLVFLIVASTNLSSINMDYYQLVQDLCIDIITFGLCFLIDEGFNTRKNTKNGIYFTQTIKNTFVTCMYVLNFINKQLLKKKKKMNFITNLMKNKNKQDFTKCAIYRIFNEFVLDFNGNPIVNSARLQEMFANGFTVFPEALKEEMWRSGLNESNLLMEKLKKVFDFKVYDVIMRERNEVIKKFIPIYENKLTVNNGLNLIATPYIDASQALAYKNTTYKTIETMIPQYTFELKKYNNNNFISSKKRKQILKCLKKKIFSWRGMWSDNELFYNHPEKLKVKILNHYTSQMSRPILSPILDLNYYVPRFSNFDLTNLFHKNEQNSELYINLDIDEILNTKNEDSRECNMDKGLTKYNSMCEPELQFNYIKAIYKLNHPTIWNSYAELNSKLNLDKIENEYNELYLNKFKVKSNNPDLRKYENSYECCFVKQSHHIRGIFYLNKEGITFSVFLNQVNGSNAHNECKNTTITDNPENLSLNKKTSFEVIERDDDFDYDRNTCFGSYFVSHHKDKNTLTFNFPYNEIRFILKRRFYHKKTALELFSILNKSYYFNFKVSSDRDTVLKAIISHFEYKREIKVDIRENVKDKEDLIIGYENISNTSSQSKKNPKANYLSSKIESWMNWKISNLEFLMWLNIYSNRSYLDLSQYPVFPWILKNYSDKMFSLPEDMRDFDVPMGMMELDAKGKERKILYLDTFFSMQQDKETGDVPYMFGSHYSNPMYVAHYLTRLFPFSHIMIELQGDKFDDPNRLFLSLENSFNCATTLKGDVRELIPEFFYLPELFLNVNNLNMGFRMDSNMQKQAVSNVQLPDWCDNNPYDYIIKIRTALESEEVSLVINDWVDLIFGYKQKGKEAENNFNVFIHTSYEDAVNIDSVDKDQRAYYLRMVEFGLTPNQLISNRSCVERFDKDHVRRGRQLTESKELKPLINSQNSFKGKNIRKPLMIKLKVIDNDKVMCVYNNNTYNICKFTPNDYRYNMELVSKNYITAENVYKINCRINEYYDENLVNCPIVIYNSGKVIAQGGYWDGRITLSYSEGNAIKLYYYFTNDSPITVLAVDKEEKYLYAGSKIGALYIFRINDTTLNLETVLFDHSQEITYVSVSNILNVLATSSLDGFVNLYTFPNNRMFRSIKLKDNIPADYIFLSCNPLPTFVVYSKLTKLFYCYSINGFFLCEEFDECKFIMSPHVITDISFNDYLIYGTNSGEFKIRKFPNMQLHNKLSLAEFKQRSEIIPIKCLDISEDKRFAYLWQLDEQDIILVKDPSVTSEAATVNLINMGFGY